MKTKQTIGRQSCTRRHRSRLGFSVVEVVIATVLFSIAFATCCLAFGQGFSFIQIARENLRATQILQDKTEILRLYTWEQVTNAGFIPLTFAESYYPNGDTNGSGGTTYYGTVTISDPPLTETYAAELKLFTFEVRWTNSTAHERQLSTLVSRLGLHDYIYRTK
jgi:Tfp pilus assembly protein PilV